MSDGEGRLPVPFAAHSEAQFVEPWARRVRDIDDHTLAGLLKTLVTLRRMKGAVTVVAALLGALLPFGLLPGGTLVYTLLIHGTLAGFVALPVFSAGTLAVRRLFLREAQRHGIGAGASMLIMTRAERCARLLSPWQAADEKVERMLAAVRDPDKA